MLQAQLRRQGGNAGHVARSPQLNSWMLSCTSDPCGERDRRTALSSERTFSADGSRGQDEDQGAGADAQVCSLTPGRRVGSEDHGCTSTRSKSKQRGTPSRRVPEQRPGWTRMGQGFAPSRSPGFGNSTGQGYCHPKPCSPVWVPTLEVDGEDRAAKLAATRRWVRQRCVATKTPSNWHRMSTTHLQRPTLVW